MQHPISHESYIRGHIAPERTLPLCDQKQMSINFETLYPAVRIAVPICFYLRDKQLFGDSEVDKLVESLEATSQPQSAAPGEPRNG